MEEILDRVEIYDVKIMPLQKERIYPYFENKGAGPNLAILRDLESEEGVNCWEYRTMKVLEMQRGIRDSIEDTDSGMSVTLTDFGLRNYNTIKLWSSNNSGEKY